MRAAWYEQQGGARDVLVVGEMPDPMPGPGEVRIRVAVSGINPADLKKRADTSGCAMPFPRVIPHSDGAGTIDRVGDGVSPARLEQRVWCYGAQSYRPFGTAAEYVVVPAAQAVALPDEVSFEQGACLGIPGITAYRAVYIAGTVEDCAVLVHGGAGAVGSCAIQLAKSGGARVFSTVRSQDDEVVARNAGASHVLRMDLLPTSTLASRIRELAPDGIDHIVEVAFDENIALDEVVLSNSGSIAAYATTERLPRIPFCQLSFKNAGIFFLGSDDFPVELKTLAAVALTRALRSGWSEFAIRSRFPLSKVAQAHEELEGTPGAGRVVLRISE